MNLQLIEKSEAQLFTRTKTREHTSLVTAVLHWLPVKFRIDFKVPHFIYVPKNTRKENCRCSHFSHLSKCFNYHLYFFHYVHLQLFFYVKHLCISFPCKAHLAAFPVRRVFNKQSLLILFYLIIHNYCSSW